LIVDRDDVRQRLARADAEGRIAMTRWGPRLGVRWWRFGAGVLLGLACGTKWSGLYFIAAFGILTVCFDLTARRAYGASGPWRCGAGVLLGLACGSRWWGLSFMAAFGFISVCFDLTARRAYGVSGPWRGTAMRDVGPALYALVLVPLGVYLSTYWAWFTSETA